ncbi:MAG: HD domain-containing protein [Bacilli bacterium]|nr:HD domain-containing protein [Bacilli bacterium]
MRNLNRIKQDLKIKLSSFRYYHSLAVAKKSKELAKHYHYDLKKAYLAGLVHDIAKEFTKEEIRKWIEIGNLSKKLLNKDFEPIVHADIGSVYLKEKYHLDSDICEAVKYHTIGNINMDVLTKIIFIADKIARKNLSKELQEVNEFAYRDLDSAIIKYLIYEKNKLESQGKQLHKESMRIISNFNLDLK